MVGGRGLEVKVSVERLGIEIAWPSGGVTVTDAVLEALVMTKGVVGL